MPPIVSFSAVGMRQGLHGACWARSSWGGPRSTNHTPQTKHGEQRTAFLHFPGRFPDGLQATGRAFWFHCSRPAAVSNYCRPTAPVQLLPPIAAGCHLPSLPILLVLMLANSARHESQ